MNDIFSSSGLSSQLQKMEEITQQIAERAHKDRNPVIEVCESLAKYIQEFEASLSSDQEVGARLVTFGQAVTFHISQVGFSKPNIVTFYGTTDNGEQVQLIQHVSQLSVLLIAMKRVSEEPKRPIGFVWN
ncbi:MAG: DUF6173 family protein [Deltaproteobacteria bacterium]|nr:DUF6173 family protein [Deltaproteobacteria bacterium]MCX5875128.1 DUF6173 family protein [Deltaproteobacteria bacterium]